MKPLTASDICWRSAPIPQRAPLPTISSSNRGTPYADDRDLCIEQLADDLQLMGERAVRAERALGVDRGALRIEREIRRLLIAILAKVSYQRDQAYARLGFGQQDDDGRDDQEPEDVL